MKVWSLIFTFLCLCFLPAFAQEEIDPCQQTMDKNSERLFKKARDFQKNGKKAEALEIYDEILAEHPEYLNVNYYYALSYYLPIEANRYQA